MDHDKTCESMEKSKTTKDLEKKKEKKKISSDKRWRRVGRNPSRGGTLRKNPPMRMMAAMVTTTATTPKGWRSVSTRSSKVRFRLASTSRESQQRESSPRHSRTDIPLRWCKVGLSPTPNLLLHLRRGRLLMAAPRLRVRGKRFAGVPVQALARQETPSRDLRPSVRGPEPRHRVARGLLVEASVGGSPFLWGKISDITISTFRCLHIFSGIDFSYVCSPLSG